MKFRIIRSSSKGIYGINRQSVSAFTQYIQLFLSKCLTRLINNFSIAYIPRNFEKCRKYFHSTAYIPHNSQKCRIYFLPNAYIPGFSEKCRDYFATTSTFRFFQKSVGTFFIFPATNQEKKSYIHIESATLSRKKLYIRSKGSIFLKKIPTLSAFIRNIHR